MWNMIYGELAKLRRCQILLVGIVALALCPVVQYGSQLMIEPQYREPDFDFPHLFANVIWGNTQIFLPISLVMIGGWLIDREYTSDTMKNIVTIPVAMPGLLTAKLVVTGMLSLVILISGQIRGAYLGGSILTFFLGYSMLFFKGGLLLSVYPFSAALILVGFDMTKYNGATSPANVLLALSGMFLMVMITLFLLLNAGHHREIAASHVKRRKVRRRGRI